MSVSGESENDGKTEIMRAEIELFIALCKVYIIVQTVLSSRHACSPTY